MSRVDTLADRREYLEAGLVDVACATCGAWVRAKKASPQQTSVQWSREATGHCRQFAAALVTGRPTALVPTCTNLRDSIDAAAREGWLA